MPEALHVKAAFVTEVGAPSKIEVGDLTIAGPGGTEAVVRVEAVCVNPVDTLVRSGRFTTLVPMPLVLGRDLVGEVISAPQFSDFTPGDRGFHARLRRVAGSFATEAVVPVERLYPILDGADPRDVVAFAHPATTAALAWFEHAQVRAGQRVFIGGAAGNLGRAAVAIAKWAGPKSSLRPGRVISKRCARPRAPWNGRILRGWFGRAAVIVNRGVVEGWLRPNITEVVGLDSARDVHERMEAGRVRGRIVLRVAHQ